MTRMLGGSLSLFALLVLSAQAEETKVDLKYKFQPGEVVRSTIEHRATVETTIQGTSQTTETRSVSVKQWKVGSVNRDGSLTFIHSVESVDLWQQMQGRQALTYNSKTDSTPPPGYEDVAKSLGKPLTEFTIDARGTILKREEKYPQPNTNPTQITIPLPAEPVSVGHVWHVPFDFDYHNPQTGESKRIQLRQQFTLQKVESGIATIGIESQVLTPVNDPTIEAQLVQRLSNGTMRFDLARGRVVGQQLDLDRRVIGFSGPASSMHYLTRVTEELIPPPATAAKPATRK